MAESAELSPEEEELLANLESSTAAWQHEMALLLGSDEDEGAAMTERPYATFSHESSTENMAAIAAQLAYDRAMAWARSADGAPYGGTEAVLDAQRSGTAPDLPDQGIPRRRGGDACG